MRGTWEHGRLVSGAFEFEDGLAHAANEWTYCTDKDRRYWKEMNHNDTLENMQNIRPHKVEIKSGQVKL